MQLTVTDKSLATRIVNQTLIVGPDFSLYSGTPSLTLRTGSSNTTGINLLSVNGFSGTVTLSASVSPLGLTTSLNPTSVSLQAGGNASSALTVSSSTPGSYSVNVTGVSGAKAHTVTISATVANADFSLSSSPASLTIGPSTNGTSIVKLTSLNQYSGTIVLSTSTSPTGLIASLFPTTTSLPSGGSVTSTLTINSSTYGNYTVTVTGISGALTHSTLLAVRIFPASTVVASDSASGTTSLYTTGGQKLIQDSTGKMIAVYVDNSGRIGVSYNNADPSTGTWSAPVKSPLPVSAYSWPAAVLVSPTQLRIIVVGGSATGIVDDVPVTITRGPANNITGFTFGAPTTLDSSGLGGYTSAILLHNGDILAAWGWENSTRSIAKSLRWDPATGWTNLAGSSTIPDNVLVDSSTIQYFVPNMIERPDNHNVYIFAGRFVSSSRIAFAKASWNVPKWSWGVQNLTYETNASDSDDDAIGLSWDPGRSLVVAEYGITGTHTYGVFSLTAADVKTHLDTPVLAVTGDRGWGVVAAQANTGDYYLFLVSVSSDAATGTFGYIRMPSGSAWNATITWLNTAVDNRVTSLRITGSNPSIDLLYVEGSSAPANLKFVRVGAPSFSVTSSPSLASVQAGSTGTSTITISSLYNFAGTVNLSATSTPGITTSLSLLQVTLTAGAISIVTLTFSTTTAGTFNITIMGATGLISQSAIVSVAVTNFNISANPTGITVIAGSTGNSTVTITSLNGFNGVVNLSSNSTLCTLSPTSIIGSGNSNLSCNFPTARVVSLIVTGTSATLSHSTTLTITVIDYTITANPTNVSALAGATATSTIAVVPVDGFAGTVDLAWIGSPGGLTCTTGPTSVVLGATQTSTLACSGPAGTYTVTVTGTSGTLSHAATITVVVTDYAISTSPANLTINAGSTTTSTVTVSPVNGFTGTIALASTVSPTGLTCILSRTTVVLGAAQNATLSCSGLAGVYTVIVAVDTGTLSHSASVTFTIQDFTITAIQPSVTVLSGSTGILTTTATSIDGFSALIALATNSTLCAISPTTVTGSGNSTLSCSFNNAGNFNILVTGTSNNLSNSAVVSYIVQDYGIIASPSSVTILAGSSGSSTLTILSINGFDGVVTLTSNSTSCILLPTSVPAGGNSTLSCNFPVSGTVAVTVSGTSGSLLRPTTIVYRIQDFVVAASSGGPVAVGAPSNLSIVITGLNQFSGIMTLADTVPPTLSCGSLTPASVNGSGTATVACTSATAGDYNLTVTATSSTAFHSVTISLSFQDFGMVASSQPMSAVLTPITTAITITPLNGFNSAVNLSYSAPSALACSLIMPANVTGSGTASISCIPLFAGNYTLIIIGNASTLTHSAQTTFTVGDFALSASSPSSTEAGQPDSATVNVNSINHFPGTIFLTDTPQNGLTCSPIPLISPSSGTVSISCTSQLAGNYTLQISGTSMSLVRATALTFQVTDFGLSSSSSPLTVPTGTNATSTITVNSINGYTGNVGVTSTNQGPPSTGGPAGPGAGHTVFLAPVPSQPYSLVSPGPQVIGNGGLAQYTLTIVFPMGTPTGNYTFIVTASDGQVTHSILVTLRLTDFVFSSPSNIVSIGAGGNSTLTLILQSLNGFQGLINLTTTASPVGPTAMISPSSIQLISSAQVLLTIIVPSGVLPGNYTLSIQASMGTGLVHAIYITLEVPTGTTSAFAKIAFGGIATHGVAGSIVIVSLVFLSVPLVRGRYSTARRMNRSVSIHSFHQRQRVDRSSTAMVGILWGLPVNIGHDSLPDRHLG